MRERLIAYLRPALRPLIIEALKEFLAEMQAEEAAQRETAPRRHLGGPR